MRLCSRILLILVFAGSASLSLPGQCAAYTPGQGRFLNQNPQAKAALIAAASANIEERIDPSTGELYYVRRTVNPWSNVVTYQIVHFNPTSEQFEAGPIAENTSITPPRSQSNDYKPCPKTVPRDSSRQDKTKSQRADQPRRSSTIKIAERF